MYYVSATASRGDQQMLDTKLPFRVRVSPPYYSGQSDDKAVVQLPLALAITSTIEHRRVHPPLLQQMADQSDGIGATAEKVSTTAAAHGASATESQQADDIELSFTSDDNGSLLSPPARQVFPTATLQRSYTDSTDSTPHLAIRTSAPSSKLDPAASLLADVVSPASPRTPPTPNYRELRAKIHSLRLAKLSNEPPNFPAVRPSPQLLSAFLAGLHTPLSFNISEEQRTDLTHSSTILTTPFHVTHIRLERSAYRPGDTVRLSLDFKAAALPTYRAWVTLDWVEEVAGSSGGSVNMQSVAASHVYCLEAVEVPLSVQLPWDATCNWASSLMRGSWRLSFRFVIGRPRTMQRRGASGWWWAGTADVEEERVEREQLEREERRLQALMARVESSDSAVSSVSMAMMCAGDPNLQVSCLQWELPLNVMPFYDDSEPTPATKGVVLDVEYT